MLHLWTRSCAAQGQPFTLKTPSRSFVLSADLMVERDQWIDVLRHVMQRPLTPQDAYCKARIASASASHRRRHFLFRLH